MMTFTISEIQRLRATEVNSLNITKQGHRQKLKPQCHAFCPPACCSHPLAYPPKQQRANHHEDRPVKGNEESVQGRGQW